MDQLVMQTTAVGFRPPTLAGYLGLSIGGTLLVGGIFSTNRVPAPALARIYTINVVIDFFRAKFTRPLLRVPASDAWLYLFDILTVAPVPGEDAAFQRRMLARNRTLFEKARRAGRTRSPIGSLPFLRADWVQHYRDEWTRLVRLNHHFDPGGILAPGPGIFY